MRDRYPLLALGSTTAEARRHALLGRALVALLLVTTGCATTEGGDDTPAQTFGPTAGTNAGTGGPGMMTNPLPGGMVTMDAGTPPQGNMPPQITVMNNDDDDAGTAGGECVPQMTNTSSALPKCSMEICPAQDSVCVPTAILETMMVSQASLDELTNCDDTSKCVPAKYVDTANTFIQPTCSSVNGAEGRCLSTCIGRVAEQADVLPRDTCAENELCTPCFDPTTGQDTGACHQGCDPGPTEEPTTFAGCCEDRGACVTPDLAGDQASSLVQLDCEAGLLCVPTELTTPTYKPPMCSSLVGAEGRCLSTCVASVAAQVDQLPSEGCGDNERCAPCYDPVTLESTGACDINGDAPVDPPTGFVDCCGDRGSCVTPALAGDQAGSLAQDSCESGLLCTPKELSDPTFQPAACDSVGGFEGRCLSDCLGAIADDVDRLPTTGCAAGEVCAPCYDPVDGEDTGACSINGDTPANAAEGFPKCCPTAGVDRGVCVTPALAGDQADSLARDDCGSGELCAPAEKAKDPSYKFPTCSAGGDPGACVPECIADNNALLGLLNPQQGGCGTGELCVPCESLIGPTGACE